MTTPASAPTRRPRHPARGGNGALAAFTVPSLVWYLLFMMGPLVAMFVIATLNWGSIAAHPKFAGLANFAKLLADERIGTALINTGIHLFATLPFQVLGAFMIGYFLAQRPPGHRIFRVVLFIPALISTAQLGTMFSVVLGPDGLVNGLLNLVGLGDHMRAWLADTHTALLCVILVSIWNGMGFNAVLFSARLASIDQSIYEAAELDGASHWRRLWFVAFPISLDFVSVMTMLQFLWSLFGSAALILILTEGGPGQATSTLSWLVYRFAFGVNGSPLIGYSQAIGILLFLLGVVGLVIIRRFIKQRY
ncbi:MAG: sugar ABC transporter permease [Propionibacteriaceae bacterium]|jgi:multiple sugar transport system permease protein|nr:sugar ABC transporter permease [Propionibacteriaceae bacterium]